MGRDTHPSADPDRLAILRALNELTNLPDEHPALVARLDEEVTNGGRPPPDPPSEPR